MKATDELRPQWHHVINMAVNAARPMNTHQRIDGPNRILLLNRQVPSPATNQRFALSVLGKLSSHTLLVSAPAALAHFVGVREIPALDPRRHQFGGLLTHAL